MTADPIIAQLAEAIRAEMRRRGIPLLMLGRRIRAGRVQASMDAIVCGLYRGELGPSTTELAAALGKRSHSTVREMVRRHEARTGAKS